MLKTLRTLSASLMAVLLMFAAMVHYGYASEGPPNINETTKVRNLEADDPWSPEELMQPAELSRLLAGEQKPVVLQIGVVHLYRLSHIASSKYAGPANSPDGLDALEKEAHGVNRNSQLVFYCGCCPWGDCPNTRPAYKLLKEMGFKKLRVLYLPQNFTQDWSMKGFPVEKGD